MQADVRLLFFDDQYLDRRENLDRRLGQPIPVPEGSYRDPDLDPSWGYPSVFLVPRRGAGAVSTRRNSLKATSSPGATRSGTCVAGRERRWRTLAPTRPDLGGTDGR